MKKNLLFCLNSGAVPATITKSVRYIQCCATDELCCLLACNLNQNKKEGKALHFYAEIPEEKKYNFS